MAGRGAKGKSVPKGAKRAAAAQPHTNDAIEAFEDAQAEVNDTAAALDGAGKSAGEPAPRPQLPDGLLQRRLENQIAEKEKAIKENELLQKRLNEMQAELELAKANVGDVVCVKNPTTPASNKVCFKPLLKKLCVRFS